MAYTCPECGKELEGFDELRRHTESRHARDLAGDTVPVADEGAAAATSGAEREVREFARSAEREALDAVEDRSPGSGDAAGTNVDAATQTKTGADPTPIRGPAPTGVVIAAIVIIAAAGILIAVIAARMAG